MNTLTYHEGQLAVNVKDLGHYWYSDPRFAKLDRDIITDDVAQMLYDQMAADFWNFDAGQIAEEYGYGKVYSEGRSGGWLIVENAPELDACDPCYGDDPTNGQCADCQRWLEFAERIRELVDGAPDVYIELLTEYLEDAQAEQNHRRQYSTRYN